MASPAAGEAIDQPNPPGEHWTYSAPVGLLTRIILPTEKSGPMSLVWVMLTVPAGCVNACQSATVSSGGIGSTQAAGSVAIGAKLSCLPASILSTQPPTDVE